MQLQLPRYTDENNIWYGYLLHVFWCTTLRRFRYSQNITSITVCNNYIRSLIYTMINTNSEGFHVCSLRRITFNVSNIYFIHRVLNKYICQRQPLCYSWCWRCSVQIFWWWIFKTRKSQSFRKKSKGYMYILFILRALLIFYTRIQYLWYTQSIYFYFIFFLSVFHFLTLFKRQTFFRRPVLECTNFSITWCSRQKRVLTICFISRTQVLIEEHTFMELWNALQKFFLIY